MKYQVLERDGQPIPPDSPDIIPPPRPTIIGVTDDDQRPAPSERNATFISNPRNVENPPTFSTVVGAPPTDTPNPTLAPPPPVDIPEVPVRPDQQLQLPPNPHLEALFTDDAYLQATIEQLGLAQLSRDLDDEELPIRAANHLLVDHVWPVEPESSEATQEARRNAISQQIKGTTPESDREFFTSIRRHFQESQALREQRFPTWLEQQDVRAIPELDIKAMYIRMGHQYAEEAAERRNRPFARLSDNEAEAIGRKVRSMQQQEMTDINPERKPDSADDYIWDTGKLILGGAADGSLATVQGIYTMTAAGLRKYRPDSENAQASARAADALSRDLGQLRQAYANTYKVDPVYADRAVGKVASFVGQSLPSVASYALGAPGIIFTTYFHQFQNNWDDAKESARRNGVRFDPDRAFNYAITVSTADAILSALPIGRAASPWLKGKGGDIIRKNFLELLKKTSTEGTISAIQGGVQDAAATHYKIDDRNPFDLQNRTFDFVVGGGTAAPFALTPQHPPTLRLDAENPPPRPPNGPPPAPPRPPSQTVSPGAIAPPKVPESVNQKTPATTEMTPPKPEEPPLRSAEDITPIREPRDWHKVFQGAATVKREDNLAKEILGFEPSDLLLTQLAGAPRHSTVKVWGLGDGENGSIFLEVLNKEADSHSIRIDRENGNLSVHIHLMVIKHSVMKGYGAHSVARIKFATERIGAKKFGLSAVGDKTTVETVNGYLVWPRFGFDTPLSNYQISLLPPELSKSRSVSDVITTELGKEWWIEFGGPSPMYFDLKPNSTSNKIFNDYKEKNDYLYHPND